jgi:transcriptional regulator with XRE-family HTH domain
MSSNHFDTAQAIAFSRRLSAARIGLDCGPRSDGDSILAKQAAGKGGVDGSTEDAIAVIGARIRDVRTMKGMPLRALADQTGLSMSMLSLVERGKTSPSIGTLIAICSALDVHMADLLAPVSLAKASPLSRAADQPVVTTRPGVDRRILRDDRVNGVEIAVNQYAPDTGSAPAPIRHEGFEYGIVLDGQLTVELDGKAHTLKPGDLISYDSARSHRISNRGRRKARALWINLRRP